MPDYPDADSEVEQLEQVHNRHIFLGHMLIPQQCKTEMYRWQIIAITASFEEDTSGHRADVC